MHIDQSWHETFQKVKDVYAVDPETLPNTYLKYYLYSDYVVEHTDANYTRANMVMDGREKKVFSAARDIIEKEQQRTADLKQTIMHLISWILPVHWHLIRKKNASNRAK